jgi:hypothetical protein
MAKNMMHAKNLLLNFWVKAMTTTIYLLNQMATHVLDFKTPRHIWCGEIIDLNNFQIFGYKAFCSCTKSSLS